MKRILNIAFVILLVSSCSDSIENVDSSIEISNPISAASQIIVVRHAEKEDGEDPGLTSQGLARAKELANIASSMEVDVIFTSQYRRTVDTAKPSSQLLEIPITQYEVNRANMTEYSSVLAEMIKSDYEGKTSLIITHSNFFMPIVREFVEVHDSGGIEESEYDKIAVIHRVNGKYILVMGSYGLQLAENVSI